MTDKHEESRRRPVDSIDESITWSLRASLVAVPVGIAFAVWRNKRTLSGGKADCAKT